MKKATLLLVMMVAALTVYAQKLPYTDGSLTPEQRADDLLGRLTVDEKISLMMDNSPAIMRLGIPEYNWWNEALHGIGRSGTATVFPQAIGMAATFDDDALYEAFVIISDEARAKFNDYRRKNKMKRYHGLTFWTPNVNIFRDPRWGRGQETYGEDPYLTTRMGVAVVKGLQGDDPRWMKTIAGAKHFAVHSGPEWNRHSFDAKDIDARDLWETYLPAFKGLVDAGVGQVMCAYNRYEGEPCCSSKKLLQQILRDEWGYDKIIVSDCWAIRDFITEGAHNTHPSGAHASADAVISGTDLECGPVYKNLGEAYRQGLITEADLDRSVRKLLITRFQLGELGNTGTPWDDMPLSVIDCDKHRAAALDMARKSMTLLKNNGILPLAKNASDIIVMGPNATDSVMQWGNYNGFPSSTITVLDGVRAALGDDVAYQRGCDHVVSDNLESCFNLFDGGLKASYWNTLDPEGDPVAGETYTSPLSLSTGGATVFTPGVNLNNFSARYEGTFIPDSDGYYVVELDASKGVQTVTLDGKTIAHLKAGGSGAHKNSCIFEGKKGQPYAVSLFFNHGDDVADLKFDIKRPVDNTLAADGPSTVIFVGGISPKLEGEEMRVSMPGFRGGDRESIELPAVQRKLLRRLKEQGKKIVYVNCSGSAVALAPEDSICDAIIQAWYPGQAGGQAVAEVIFGDYNPAGRLPVTFYASDAQLPDFEDYDMDGRTYRYFREKPLYAFGHGLSYTTFDYRNGRLDKKSIKPGQSVKLTFDLANTGGRDGDEVAQVYVRSLDNPAAPIKSLKAFRRLPVGKGSVEKVEFELGPEAFETFDIATQRMATLPGRFEVLYGGSSDSLQSLPLTVK